MSGNMPMERFRVGSVSASVWNNKRKVDGRVVDVVSVSVARNYQENGEWKSTSTYGVNDLQKLILAAQKAQEFLLCGKENNDGEDGKDGQSFSSSC